MQIPQKLLSRLQALGLDETIYEKRARKCILSKQAKKDRVPWYKNAFFVHEKQEEFIFDPVSLVPCLALEPKKEDKMLDMCAAPGTKTFILSFMTDNKAQITANDVDKKRILRLRENARKYGLACSIICESGRKLKGEYDKILVDAPCSGMGMVNKKEKLFRHWNDKRVNFFAKKQKKLIKHAFEILEPGGTLVYSTCTFSPEENECIVDFLLKKNKNAFLEEIHAKIKHLPGLKQWHDEKFSDGMENCMRIYPQQNNTAGFFVAKIKKT